MSEIKYWTPIQNAWKKMVTVLFRPFDFGKWMLIGFTAFLAQCGRDGGGGGGSGGSSGNSDYSDRNIAGDLASFRDIVVDVWFEHTTLILVIGGLTLFMIIALTILTNWLNGRGQFMFLDNVLKNRGAVKEPWREYRKEGNSLMIFQIVLDLIVMVSMLAIIGGILFSIFPMIVAESFSGRHLGGILLLAVLFVVVCIVYGFVKMVLTHFVVPLMYKHRFSVREGFQAFEPILKKNFWRILLFGLVMTLVNSAIAAVIILGILLTCCTALILIIIPYIGTVALLPIHVFQRFIGVEFLKQFGDEYDLLAGFSEPQSQLMQEKEPDCGVQETC